MPINFIEINPDSEFSLAVYSTLGEGQEKVENFLETNPKHRANENSELNIVLKNFLTDQLRGHYEEITSDKRYDRRLALRLSLQYLLNHDKDIPYATSKYNITLKSKEGSLVQKILNSCQDTIAPYDGYMLCQWMWEILFGEEDWCADVREWKIIQ
jgi:hypothetical protein